MQRWTVTRPIPVFLRSSVFFKDMILHGLADRSGSGTGSRRLCSSFMGMELRWRVISTYGRVLEKCSSPIELETDLPFPKEMIRQAIREELMENPAGELRSHLEVAYVQLESFLPPEEYKVIQDFKEASSRAQEMARSGDPNDIIASARILRNAGGDKAVKIQERISEKMGKRLEQVRAFGIPLMMRAHGSFRSVTTSPSWS